MNKKILIGLIFLFLISYGYAITNIITEPIQPVDKNIPFQITNIAKDINYIYTFVNNGDFNLNFTNWTTQTSAQAVMSISSAGVYGNKDGNYVLMSVNAFFSGDANLISSTTVNSTNTKLKFSLLRYMAGRVGTFSVLVNNQVMWSTSNTSDLDDNFHFYTIDINQTGQLRFNQNCAGGAATCAVRLDTIKLLTATQDIYFSDANVRINFNNQGYQQMNWNAPTQTYIYSNSGILSAGDYNYAILTTKSGYDTAYNQGIIHVVSYASNERNLTITDIQNVTHTTGITNINLIPTDETQGIIYSVENLDTNNFTIDYNTLNSLNEGKQYYIYTADQEDYDANRWTFNSTLTYGQTVTTPIQKIWNNNTNKYEHSFTDILAVGEKKYYKLTYRNPMTYYENITGNPDWFFTYPPTLFVNEGQIYDSFDTGILNPFRLDYPIAINLLPDVNVIPSFEFQFTAYALSNFTITVNGTPVTITPTPHRYSVSINDTNLITMQSTPSTANTIYFTDWALNERAYWKTRMNFTKENYELLDVWINPDTNTSFKYFDELSGFRVGATAYDREGTATTLKVDVYAYSYNDINKIKHAEYDINYRTPEKTISLNQLVSHVVITKDPPLPNYTLYNSIIKVRATICGIDLNGQENCFDQIEGDIIMRNYPYFNNDMIIQVREEARQLNTAPHGKIILQGRGELAQAFERVNMYIYKGNWECPHWRLNQPLSGCTTQNTATINDLMNLHEFDNGVDWTCNSSGDCSFEYDLRNYFKYPVEETYTTFAQVLFTTWDTNIHYGRVIYDIGRQPLVARAEFMGLDASQFDDINCHNNIDGLLIQTYDNAITLQTAIMGLTTLQPLLTAGILTAQGILDFANSYITGGKDITQGIRSPIVAIIGDSFCKARFPESANIKMSVYARTTALEDIHNYLNVKYKVFTPEGTEISPYFYPTSTSYQQISGENLFIFNNILTDVNGNYLINQQDYNIIIYITDQSYQNRDTTMQMNLKIDNNIIISPQGQTPVILPISYSAVDSTGNLTIRQYIATREKIVDKAEFILYTKYSSFDPNKTDTENQIIKYNLSAEDILLLDEDLDFNVSNEFEKFKSEKKADIYGACVSGGGIGGLIGLGVGSIIVITGIVGGTITAPTGVGAAAGILVATAGSTMIAGAVGGCGIGSVSNWAITSAGNAEINTTNFKAFDQFQAQKYKKMDVSFENLNVNDYDELLTLGGYKEEDVSPDTIINKLKEDGKTLPKGNITIRIGDKKYTKENVLVSKSTLIEAVKKRDLDMRTIIYYNYFNDKEVTTQNIYIVERQKTDWAIQLNSFAIYIFNTFAPAIILITFIIILLSFARNAIFK